MRGEHETIWDDKRTLVHFRRVTGSNELLPAHWHNHLEILYITAGAMKAYINEVVYELNCGDIVLVNPQDIHYTHVHGSCEYYLLQIPAVHLERIREDWKLLHFREYLPGDGETAQLNQRLTAILREWDALEQRQEKGGHLLILVQLYRFLYLLYTEASDMVSSESRSRTERDFQRVEQIMEYVKAHYREPVSLAEAAGHLSLSTEYFCRLFKKYTGQTFLEYVSQVRMSRFYEDLLQTEDSITFLLDKHGITNYKTFMKGFKAAYGTTPYKLRSEYCAGTKMNV